jgi:hypothetical protein
MTPLVVSESPEPQIALNAIQGAIIKTLLYFHTFKYPLTGEEILENCQKEIINSDELVNTLKSLCDQKLIFCIENFYLIADDDSLVSRRKKGNQQALRYMSTARKFTRLIAVFPFVEGVFISGSVAKGYVDEHSDIDYFIITRPSRLWLCRTLLILFKKTILLNSRKYFCLNYFIDTQNLELPDRNIFTATELTFAKPVYNPEVCRLFLESNNWREAFYPGKPVASMNAVQGKNKNPLKLFGEWVFKGFLGEWLDNCCFRLTLRVWKKKFKQFDESEFDLNFRSRKNVSKHHPGGFQYKVLAAHQEAIEKFANDHQLQFMP